MHGAAAITRRLRPPGRGLADLAATDLGARLRGATGPGKGIVACSLRAGVLLTRLLASLRGILQSLARLRFPAQLTARGLGAHTGLRLPVKLATGHLGPLTGLTVAGGWGIDTPLLQ